MRLEEITKSKKKQREILPIASQRLHHNFIGGLAVFEGRIITSSEDGRLAATNAIPFAPEEVILKRSMPINHIALSPSGDLLAAASDDKNIYLIDTDDWEIVETLKNAHDSYVTRVAFAGDRLVSVSHDATIKIWDFETGEMLHKLEGHGDWVYRLAVSPDNQYIFTTSNNCSAKVWNLQTGQEVKHLVDGGTLVYGRDGTMLLFGGSNDTGIGNKTFVRAALWADNGMVYSAAQDIVCWDSSDWSVKWQIDCSYDSIHDLIQMPEHNLLVAVSDIIYGIDATTGEVRFSQKNVDAVPIYSCGMVGQDYLVTGDKKGNVSVWNINDLANKGAQVSFGGDVYKPVFIPASNRMAAGSWLGGVLSLWGQDGQFIKDFKGFNASSDVKIMGALPKEPHKIIPISEGRLKIIDTLRGEITDTIPMDNPKLSVQGLFWISDTECLASCVNAWPRLVNVETKEVKIVRSNYSLGDSNFKLSDELILLQLAFYKEEDAYMTEDAVFSDISLEIAEGKDKELMDSHAPLIVYNLRTKEIMHEWWVPRARPTKDYSTRYGWPTVGGPNNSVIMACYGAVKTIYFWKLGKDKPQKPLKLKNRARSSYSNPYPLFANDKMLIFRLDSMAFRYDLATKQWSEFKLDGYKSSHHKEKNLLAVVDGNYTLKIWDVENWGMVHEERFKFKLEQICFGTEQLFIYNKEKGVLAYRLHFD